MIAFIARRLLLAIPMLLGSALIVFSIFYLSRVDPVKRSLGDRSMNPETVERLRTELGLNRPAHVRFFEFVTGIFVGDFGKSIRTQQPVAEELKARFPATLELAALALVLSVGYGFTAGLLSALKKDTWIDYGAMGIALVAVSMPVFWFGLMMSYIFGERLQWLPTQGRQDVMFLIEPVPDRTGLLLIDTAMAGNWPAFGDALSHLILPAITLAAVTSALTARMTRAAILEVMQQDFLRTARAKGVSQLGWLRHLLRNALLPIITIVGLEIPALLGGSVITEQIFGWPGMGSYLIDSILSADITATQGIVIFMTVLFIGVNIAVDAAYAVIDPRIRAA